MTPLEVAYVAFGVVSALVVFSGAITLAVMESRRRIHAPLRKPGESADRESHQP